MSTRKSGPASKKETSVGDLPVRFLSPENRLPKISVWTRAELCLADLKAVAPNDSPDIETYCRAANRSALTMAFAGDLAESERSCHRQIGVLIALVRHKRIATRELARVFQPWVNIGRLRVIQGRWEEALDHFTSPKVLEHADQALPLGKNALTPAESRGVPTDEASLTFVRDSHIVETAKALARGGRQDLLEEHVELWRDQAGRIPHLEEAETILALRRGERRALAPPQHRDARPARVALRIHVAAKQKDQLENLVTELDTLGRTPASADMVTLLRAGADTLLSWDLDEDATRVLLTAEQACREIGDEIDLYLVLSTLARLSPDAGHAEEARAIADRTGHTLIRHLAERPPPPPVAEQPQLAALRDAEREAASRLVPAPVTFV